MQSEDRIRTEQIDVHEAYDCGRCGLCLTACPVYRMSGNETYSPRAKVQLSKYLSENQIDCSAQLKEVFSNCLMCGECTANCPSGVHHDTLYMRIRSRLSGQLGHKWPMRLIYYLLTHEQKMELAAKIARFGRNVVMEKVLRDFTPGRFKTKHTPKFNPQPFRSQYPEVINPKTSCQGTVLYFAGCATNYVFGGIGHSIVSVLTQIGYKVIIPKDQVCCGLPVFIHGEVDRALKNIQQNIDTLNRDDALAVVTDCATCGSALRCEYQRLLNSIHQATEAAESLSAKVFDVSEFLFDHFNILEPHLQQNSKKWKLTYHNPCHLRNVQGVKSKVEQLLALLPNVTYLSVPDKDSCCGGGGSFAFEHPEIAGRIVDQKIKNARDTGAVLWSTGCPGCNVNLRMNLKSEDTISMVHPIQIVDDAIHQNLQL